MSWRRTPFWIAFGGASLAATAGFVNATGYLGVAHRGVSHVTGQVTQLGVGVAAMDGGAAASAALLVVAFLVGATLSGVLIRSSELTDSSQRRYGAALLVESALLGIAAAMQAVERGTPELVVAAAMGLQNAMASTYSGAIVRTTHVTGIATDLGILFGQLLRGERPEPGRAKLLALLLIAFLGGTVLGGATFAWLGRFTLVVPALSLAVVSLLWIRLARSATAAVP